MKVSSINRKPSLINCNGNLVSLERPIVMGILNITPDSFYDGGKYLDKNIICERARQILQEGATFIDIGAASTRPGAGLIAPKEEIERLKPAMEAIRGEFPDSYISIDTYNSDTARFCVEKYDVAMINDISGGQFDEGMFETIAALNVPYVMMHTKGTPETMQNNPVYDDIIKDLAIYFAERIEKLKLLGANDLIVDPGFGFGKTIEQNFELLRRLDELKIIELPMLIGLSRKSMIFRTLNISAAEALNGTTALNMIALTKGADILRVHDVKEAIETVHLWEMLQKTE